MKILKCCKLNLMQWRLQPKFLMVFVFFVLNTMERVFPYKAFAQATGLKIAPWLLPGLVGANGWYLMTILAFVLLICDAPFLNRQQQFVLQRVGKVRWLIGQLLYLLVLSLAAAVLTWVLSWIVLLPEVEWTTQWGAGIQSATRHYSDHVVRPPFTVTSVILKQWTAMGATGWVFLMQVLIGMFLGELVMVCNLWTRRGVGVSLAVFWVLLATIVERFTGYIGYVKYLAWCSPLSWMDLTLVGKTANWNPPLGYALGMLLLLCVGLAALALCNIHKCSLDTDKE